MLCKLYKGVQGRVGQHLLHGSPRAGCPGALADALLALAQGLTAAHTDIRYAHPLALPLTQAVLSSVGSVSRP